jgi:D-alanine transaminase
MVPVEDRGFMFADGVYEVVRYYNGRALAMDEHIQRLRYSLDRLRIDHPAELADLPGISDQLLDRNRLTDASVYWQVTRGVARRAHPFPRPAVRPTVLAMAYAEKPIDLTRPPVAMRAISHPDIRWPLCSIKSVSLLGNVLARQAAADHDAHEAVMLNGRIVTEGTARTIVAVYDGKLRTHPLDGRILGSITRQIVLDSARAAGIAVNENYFDLKTLFGSDEVLAVGTTTEVASIIELDGRQIGDGKPGPMADRLLEMYRRHVREQCDL